MAPVETCTVPSKCKFTSALPWFKKRVVNEIPNFTAVAESPRKVECASELGLHALRHRDMAETKQKLAALGLAL